MDQASRSKNNDIFTTITASSSIVHCVSFVHSFEQTSLHTNPQLTTIKLQMHIFFFFIEINNSSFVISNENVIIYVYDTENIKKLTFGSVDLSQLKLNF